MYSRFYISGRDIAASFTDCVSDNWECSLSCQPSACHNQEPAKNLCSLVDRCGMAVIVDQVLNTKVVYSILTSRSMVCNLQLDLMFSSCGYLILLLFIFV